MKSDLSTRDFLIYAKGIRVVWVPNLFLKQIVNHYIVLQENAIMKNPETREWENCIIYQEYKHCTPEGYVEVPESERKIFVREKKDFLRKFTLCLDL